MTGSHNATGHGLSQDSRARLCELITLPATSSLDHCLPSIFGPLLELPPASRPSMGCFILTAAQDPHPPPTTRVPRDRGVTCF